MPTTSEKDLCLEWLLRLNAAPLEELVAILEGADNTLLRRQVDGLAARLHMAVMAAGGRKGR